MFIIKLGQEALNRLEEQISEHNYNEFKNPYNIVNNKLESSILYNLLLEDNVKHENYQLNESVPCPRPKTVFSASTRESIIVSPRPYSAPDSYSIPVKCNSFLSFPRNKSAINNIKFSQCQNGDQSPSISCSTDSFVEEPMDLSSRIANIAGSNSNDDMKNVLNTWLLSMMNLVYSDHHIVKVNDLPDSIRLHLLQSSWHRLLVSLMFEYLVKQDSVSVDGVWKFIHSSTGLCQKTGSSNMKMYKVYKNLVDELYTILADMNRIDIDNELMGCLRVVLYLAGDQEDVNRKLMIILENFLESREPEGQGQQQQRSNEINSDISTTISQQSMTTNHDNSSSSSFLSLSDQRIILLRNVVEKMIKLNSVIIETVFYSHLSESMDNVLEKLFYNS